MLSLQAAIRPDWELDEFLNFLATNYRADNLIINGEPVDTPYGKAGITEGNDDYSGGGNYIVVGFILPDGIYAEIEDGTYGEMQGFRIYKNT